MKIVEVITAIGCGGAEHFIIDLSNQLAKEHNVCLITLLDDENDSATRNFYRSEISSNIQYVNLKLPHGLKFSSQWKVYGYLRRLKPDVIHIHLVPSLKYCALAVGLLSITNKIYCSVHSDLHNGYDSGLFKLYCNTLGRFGRFKLSCLSKKNYDDFKVFYPHTSIRCITNGRAPIVATDLFDSVKEEMNHLRSDNHSRLLIHMARCHPVKNQMLLVKSVNTVIRRGYNIDLVVAGADFDTPEGQEIMAAACDRIHFIGEKRNISDYILNADIFCLSSDFEGMPLSLIEASLAGVPAVSTPVCGAVDLIKDGENGFLSKSHSVEDYSEALIKSLDNYEVIKSNALRMKNDSPYTIEECANKYVEYFNQ
jgi:glycosyltransferase involved in cell wall biosynthesis